VFKQQHECCGCGSGHYTATARLGGRAPDHPRGPEVIVYATDLKASAHPQVAPLAALDCTEELQQVCETHLSLLSLVFERFGSLDASVHIRVPASLKSGALELQRVAWTRGFVEEQGTENQAILIGGPDSSLTEEHITSQKTLSLPSQGHLVLPLTYSSFLVSVHH
jgi:hypothetical protein